MLPSDERAYYLTLNHLTLTNVKTFVVTAVVRLVFLVNLQ